MKHLKLFENFEIVDPIKYGEPLNNREINFLREYNVMCPEFIKKDDNYYYVFNHRCENIKDLPLTYIHGLCSKFYISDYTINDDFSIDVKSSVYLCGKSLTRIPLIFNVVMNFDCSVNNLTTLEGSPKYVGGDFLCNSNNLTTLEGSPKSVGGDFNCTNNKLTTLEGGPQSVNGNFVCHRNKLSTLKGSPKEVFGYFFCHTNQLTSLEGSPKIVGGGFDCSINKLTTLEGGPEYIGRDLFCSENPLISKEYKGFIKGELIYRQ